MPAGGRVPGTEWLRYDGTSGREDDPRALRRRYFRERDGMRRTHIHVREQGHPKSFEAAQ